MPHCTRLTVMGNRCPLNTCFGGARGSASLAEGGQWTHNPGVSAYHHWVGLPVQLRALVTHGRGVPDVHTTILRGPAEQLFRSAVNCSTFASKSITFFCSLTTAVHLRSSNPFLGPGNRHPSGFTRRSDGLHARTHAHAYHVRSACGAPLAAQSASPIPLSLRNAAADSAYLSPPFSRYSTIALCLHAVRCPDGQSTCAHPHARRRRRHATAGK